MRGKKTRLTEKAKVIKAKLQTPEISLRDIEKDTKVPMKTADRVIKSLGKLDTNGHMIEKLDDIVGQIIDIQRISISGFRDKAMQQKLSTKEVKDLSEIGKTNRERKQILEGKPTDITKIDFDLGSKSIKELEDFRQSLLSGKK